MKVIIDEKGKKLFVTKTDIDLIDRVHDKLTIAATYFGMQEARDALNGLIDAIKHETGNDEQVREEDQSVEDEVEEDDSIDEGNDLHEVPVGGPPE